MGRFRRTTRGIAAMALVACLVGSGVVAVLVGSTPTAGADGLPLLTGVVSMSQPTYRTIGNPSSSYSVAAANGFCAVLTSSALNCWGDETNGDLGNGIVYPGGNENVPVPVLGVGGAGSLTGIQSVTNDSDYGYCAVLNSGGVDCWGYGPDGELGNGALYPSATAASATPQQVVGVGGTGTLSGVTSLASDGMGICAVLTSGGVDCWGYGGDGELGNGALGNSPTPVAVSGVGGTGLLSGVASLASDGTSYCALLSSGGVDCWGYGPGGELGNGGRATSATPVQVEGVGGSGLLSDVVSQGLVSGYAPGGDGSYCVSLLSSGQGGLACWGNGGRGQLGQGVAFNSGFPVQVVGVGGSGMLPDSGSLESDGEGYCAVLLVSGGVDCWGEGGEGELGNGANADSATPVQVVGQGSHPLSGVGQIGTNGQPGTNTAAGYCALLLSGGGVDCWGEGGDGELGNGANADSAIPVQVVGVGDSGTLSGVASLGTDSGNECALLTSSDVDCWGNGGDGQRGDGTDAFSSDSPVSVLTTAPSTYIITPSNNAVVSGTAVLGEAYASPGTTQVQFEASGGPLSLNDQIIATATQTSSGWTAYADSTGVPDGTYTIQSVASFADGASTTSPPVTITVQNTPVTNIVLPSNNATLSGTVTLDAVASTGASGVQFEFTGGGLTNHVFASATPTIYGWVAQWDTKGLNNGSYTLQSVATWPAGAYSGGNSATSPPITVSLLNAPPSTAVLVPSNGAILTGTQVLDASASSGVRDLQFELSGGPDNYNDRVISGAVLTLYGYVGSWDTTSVPDGTYTLQSVASWSGGTVPIGTSPAITITVQNTPTTSIVLPSNNASLSGTANLDAVASPGASTVQFELSGGPSNLTNSVIASATLTLYGWLATWDTTTVPNGSYTLQSVATYPAGAYPGGNSATSPPTAITVQNPATSIVLPSNNASLSGAANLDAVASPGASTVQYELSGGPSNLTNSVIASATLTLYGWLATWDTRTVPDGTYTLQSVATYPAGLYPGGNSATSQQITITVDNPLSIQMLPTNAGTVDANLLVTGTVILDAIPIKGGSYENVSFYLDGSELGNATPTIYGYVLTFDTTSVSDSRYILSVESGGIVVSSTLMFVSN